MEPFLNAQGDHASGLQIETLRALRTPCALVDLEVLERNCRNMATRMSALGVRLRPHVKTHKCVEVARRQVQGHFGGIMVSTFAEARYFAAAGFSDMTYGVPIALDHLREAAALALTLERLSVLVDHPATLAALEEVGQALNHRFSVFLKVDCGYHRAGVDPTQPASIELAKRLASSPYVDFRGILSHSGHSYYARTVPDIASVGAAERDTMRGFARELAKAGVKVKDVSVGSTPTLSVCSDLTGITEVRPGNYAFYDSFQAAIGSCRPQDAAFSILVTVISAYPEKDRLLINAGSLALSKDIGAEDLQAKLGYGTIYDAETGQRLPGLHLDSLSQEHGLISGAASFAKGSSPVGRKLRIVPNHSCLAAAQHSRYHVVQAGALVDVWEPTRGW